MNRVIRPGPLQYVYLLLVPAFLIFIGVAIFSAGFSAEPPDWVSRLPWATGITVAGLLWAAYVLGLTVEIDDAQVSKLYLFGLLRESIPIARLAADVSSERDQYRNSIQYVNYATLDGRGAFTLLRTWAWRASDVDALLAKAHTHSDVQMRRQNWILSAFALALPLSGIAIFVVAILLLITHALFRWPS